MGRRVSSAKSDRFPPKENANPEKYAKIDGSMVGEIKTSSNGIKIK